jgi:hypothetical protein
MVRLPLSTGVILGLAAHLRLGGGGLFIGHHFAAYLEPAKGTK